MKKILALLLALAMVFAFAACGEEPAAESEEPTVESEAPAAESEEPAGEEPAVEPICSAVRRLHREP